MNIAIKKSELANIACNYIHMKKNTIEKRSKLAKRIKDYKKKGFKWKEIQEI